jgi:KDO2-lipid IV(A) lauroyltransferase
VLNYLLSHGGIVFMRLLGQLPLWPVRALGWWLGAALYLAARSRRRVVLANLRLCFLQWSDQQRDAVAWKHFIHFAQAWLDRGWLWHGRPQLLQQRLRLTGEVQALQAAGNVVIFAPHFVGLDAGWTALTRAMDRRFTTIYSHQSNTQVDGWIKAGRERFGQVRLFDRAAGPKPVVQALRHGEFLYLLPDMNYGLNESIFVPFYGVPAATVTSLSRLARLGQAQVVPVVTRLTPEGYDVQVMPAWTDVPSGDLPADTLKMNQRLEAWIDSCPDQYYWVHKRFKDRPEGEAAIY